MMLGLTREDWKRIAELVRRDDDTELLAKIGEEGRAAHEAATRLFNACRESLHWWEDSYSTIGCDESYIHDEIRKNFDDDTVRIVKVLRAAVASAQTQSRLAESAR